MSAMINVNREVKDPFYRYKMPRIQAKIEGRGNGIKTLVSNMTDVAKSLHRPPTYITKFFGADLGSLTNWDEKAGRYIVNGAHDAEKLQNSLDGFIKKFVLCLSCANPETILSVKGDIIYRTCKACGAKGPCDLSHRLCAFIKQNPPPKPQKLRQAKDQATGNADREGGAEESMGMVAPDDLHAAMMQPEAEVDEDDWDEEAAAANREAELATLSEHVKSSLALGADHHEEGEGGMAKKEKSRRKLGSKSKSRLGEEDGEGFEDPLEVFGQYLEAHPELSNERLLEEIGERGLRRDKAVAVLVQVLFAQDFCAVLKARSSLLARLLESEKEQQAFLGALDRLAALVNPRLVALGPVILQQAYALDLLEEEVLLDWRDNPSRRFVTAEQAGPLRKACQPFFQWLEQEEEEEEDDEE